MILYHGTSSRHLQQIREVGIRPRVVSVGTWQVRSHRKDVYLSSCYAFYFAQHAADQGEDSLVLEIDTDGLDPRNLHADEDALESFHRGRDNIGSWDMKRRTIYYRSRSHHYSSEASLAHLGTCAYRGTVPAASIKRACVIEPKAVARLVIRAFDPLIVSMNYKLYGERYKDFHKWLFGDIPTYEPDPTLPRDGIAVIAL